MKILFLCVANSARSQMAEGMARVMVPAHVEVASAGSEPTSPNPVAVAAMAEVGIDISQQSSTSVQDVVPDSVDVVVTLCAEEVCPAFLGSAERHHWPIEDPAGEGSLEELLPRFREAREKIRDHLREYLRRMEDSPRV